MPGIIITLATMKYFHAILVRRVWFDKIYYVESKSTNLVMIMNSKEKPLSTTTRIDISLK